jgi:5-methylcytosine-specific restriction endonuclease McrA
MYPSKTWCKISCISNRDSCVFENACGHRKKFLRVFKRKQHQSMRRHSDYNGHTRSESYIPYQDMMALAKAYLQKGFKCFYCNEEMCIGNDNSHDSCTVDHKKPISRGGSNSIDNLVLCCEACNITKGGNEFYVE